MRTFANHWAAAVRVLVAVVEVVTEVAQSKSKMDGMWAIFGLNSGRKLVSRGAWTLANHWNPRVDSGGDGGGGEGQARPQQMVPGRGTPRALGGGGGRRGDANNAITPPQRPLTPPKPASRLPPPASLLSCLHSLLPVTPSVRLHHTAPFPSLPTFILFLSSYLPSSLLPPPVSLLSLLLFIPSFPSLSPSDYITQLHSFFSPPSSSSLVLISLPPFITSSFN